LVIDTLMTFVPFQDGMSSDASQVARYLSQLKARVLGMNKNASIVILHHLRKGLTGADKNFNDMAGSYAFRASTDMNILLTKPFGKGDTRRRMAVEGRLEGESSVVIDLTDDGYVLVRDVAAAEPNDSDQKLIASYVKIHQGAADLSVRELAVAVGVKKNQAEKFKKQLSRTTV
jgi:hypothetical protein